MIAEERVRRVGGQVFVAGGKLRGYIEFRPQPVLDSLPGAAPPVKLAGDITADFNSHPAAAVVIDSVHGTVCVPYREGIAHHRVPLHVEIAPTLAPFRKSDQYRPHRATRFGMRAIGPRHHDWNTIEMVHNDVVGQDFSLE